MQVGMEKLRMLQPAVFCLHCSCHATSCDSGTVRRAVLSLMCAGTRVSQDVQTDQLQC
jgi:hypothetical protein